MSPAYLDFGRSPRPPKFLRRQEELKSLDDADQAAVREWADGINKLVKLVDFCGGKF